MINSIPSFKILKGMSFLRVDFIDERFSDFKDMKLFISWILVNPFMHNVKWPNILLKSCGVHTARFSKYVWPFYNIMHERVNFIL